MFVIMGVLPKGKDMDSEKQEIEQAYLERDWWNKIGITLWNSRCKSWSYKTQASFTNGVEVNDRRIAEALMELVELREQVLKY